MNALYQKVRAGLLLSLLLGCASTPTNQQMIDLTQRIEFDGISVLPPQAENWALGVNQQEGIVFKKQLSESLNELETHTFLAGIRHVDLNEKAPKNSHELLAFIKSTFPSKDDARFQNTSIRSFLDDNRSKAMNTDCAQYELVTKESANPLFHGKVFMLTTYGFQCRHPYSTSIIVDAFCTERYQENHPPVSQAYKDECTAFLNDVQFKPLSTRTEGFIDSTYLNVPAWNYPQWQQIVSAAKMINMQGNLLGAERLCNQALHLADANTIKSLYAYADLLDTQQHDRSTLVRGRANKLLELRIKLASANKAQTTWLGFQPEEILEEYATLLETLHQTPEAESIRTLGKAYRYTQEVHAVRLRTISQGGNALGMCSGFQDRTH
jgi:hypothetical protein